MNEDITYDELVLMMQRVFKTDQDLLIKYKDEDNDLITIFDDSDIKYAIQINRILKLTLFVNGESSQNTSVASGDMRTSLIKIRDQVNQMLDSMTVSKTKDEVEALAKEEGAPSVASLPQQQQVLPPISTQTFDPLNNATETSSVSGVSVRSSNNVVEQPAENTVPSEADSSSLFGKQAQVEQNNSMFGSQAPSGGQMFQQQTNGSDMFGASSSVTSGMSQPQTPVHFNQQQQQPVQQPYMQPIQDPQQPQATVATTQQPQVSMATAQQPPSGMFTPQPQHPQQVFSPQQQKPQQPSGNQATPQGNQGPSSVASQPSVGFQYQQPTQAGFQRPQQAFQGQQPAQNQPSNNGQPTFQPQQPFQQQPFGGQQPNNQGGFPNQQQQQRPSYQGQQMQQAGGNQFQLQGQQPNQPGQMGQPGPQMGQQSPGQPSPRFGRPQNPHRMFPGGPNRGGYNRTRPLGPGYQ